MTTKLILYNGALRALGERKLASLTEAREARYLLDDVWDEGFVNHVLGDGQWVFATRSSSLTASTSIDPAFGLGYAFEQPDDYIITSAICSDEYYDNPLLRYKDEAGIWYADIDVLFVQYISNHAEWGGDLTKWTTAFCDFAQHYMAWKVSLRMTQSKVDKEQLEKDMKKLRLIALNRDARNKPTKFPAQGSWINSRRGYRGSGNAPRPNSINSY